MLAARQPVAGAPPATGGRIGLRLAPHHCHLFAADTAFQSSFPIELPAQ